MAFLRKILFPLALLYGLVVYIRNWLYDKGFFSSHKIEIPSICIGNLSVGGTGKTPMADYLITLLKKEYSTGLLSRGYKRKSSGFVTATKETTVEMLGDEPYQLYKKHQEIFLAVDANRTRGVEKMIKYNPGMEIILLDDAFQHRKVTAGLNILLSSYQDLFMDDYYLPSGNLRDHKQQYKRADIIVITKCPEGISKKEQASIKKRLQLLEKQSLYFSYLKYNNSLIGKGDSVKLEDLKGKNFSLVTGIANPEPLKNYLSGRGLTFEHLAFPDHHFFGKKDLTELGKRSFILTTEKDYVRLNGLDTPLYYIGIEMDFITGKNSFNQEVLACIKS